MIGTPEVRTASESLAISEGNSSTLRLLVPAALCGIIIGRGGETIRGFGEDSKTNITVSNQDRQPPGVPDRIVRITAPQDGTAPVGQLRAVSLLTDRMLQSPNYSKVTRSSLGYGRPPAYRAAPAAGTALRLLESGSQISGSVFISCIMQHAMDCRFFINSNLPASCHGCHKIQSSINQMLGSSASASCHQKDARRAMHVVICQAPLMSMKYVISDGFMQLAR